MSYYQEPQQYGYTSALPAVDNGYYPSVDYGYSSPYYSYSLPVAKKPSMVRRVVGKFKFW
jgi:hypothetical protein